MVKSDIHFGKMKLTAFSFILLLGISPLLWNCATTIPPTGGPKDSLPPNLLNSSPKNNETSFTRQEVTLEFDETVILKNAKEEISITPSPGKDVDFYAKKNLITVRFKKPLEADKTYSISFRQSIQDITEGNPAEDLRLAFSTGQIIDSLKVFGTVHLLPAAIPVTKYTVALYQSDTFNIFKHTPVYFTRTDKSGRFTIYNLKPGNYRIYCFEDKNKNLKCDSQSERFGVYTDSLKLPRPDDSLRLIAVKLDSRPFKMNSYRNISNYGMIRFNKTPLKYSLTRISTGENIHSITSVGKSEVTYYPILSHPDSLQVRLSATDSLGQTIDSTFYIRQTSQKPVKEKFNVSLGEASYTYPNQLLTATLTYSIPIKSRFPDSVSLYSDTIFYKTLPFKITRYDTTLGKVTLESKLSLSDSLQKKSLNLHFPEGAFISILNDSSKIVQKKMTIRTIANLASLIVLNNPKPGHYLELLTDKGEIITRQLLSGKNTFQYLDPNAVQLRILNDSDKNENWTWPNVLKNTPAEDLTYYTNKEGKRSIPLRANWEVEIDWTKPIIVDKKPIRASKPKK